MPQRVALTRFVRPTAHAPHGERTLWGGALAVLLAVAALAGAPALAQPPPAAATPPWSANDPGWGPAPSASVPPAPASAKPPKPPAQPLVNRETPKTPKGAKKPRRKLRVTLEADTTFDENAFLLSTGQQKTLNNRDSANLTSGRLVDMESVEDFVVRPTLTIDFLTEGLAGRDLDLALRMRYAVAILNPKRSYFDLRADVDQSVGPGNHLSLALKYTFGEFRKNYLVDAIDANLNTNIELDERVYRPGQRDVLDLTLRYRHRFSRRAKKAGTVGLYGELGLSYTNESYDAPLGFRDRTNFAIDATLTFKPFKGFAIAADYRLRLADSGPATRVLILDEPQLGFDVNGDGDALDPFARTAQLVDASFTANVFGVTLTRALSSSWTLEVGYHRRLRSFSSTQPLDLTHRDREDARHDIQIGFKHRLSKRATLRIIARYRIQDITGIADPDGPGEDYRQLLAGMSLAYRF